MVLTGTSLFLLCSKNFCPVFEAATGNWSSRPEENGSPGRSPRCTTLRCRWWVNWVWKLTSENQWSFKGRVYIDYTALICPDLSLAKSGGTNHDNWTSDLEIETFKQTIWGHSQRKLGLNEEKRGLNQQSKGFSHKNGEGCKFYQVDMSYVHVSSWKNLMCIPLSKWLIIHVYPI